MDLTGALVIGASAATVFTFGNQLIGALKQHYGRTWGSRRAWAIKLDGLACGVTLTYAESLLGPCLFRRRLGKLTERVYATPHAWVQLLTASGEGVVRIAITVTDRRFSLDASSLTMGVLRLRLGRDCFASAGTAPVRARPAMGARRAGYAEFSYAGNPGGYQYFALSWNDASPVGDIDVEGLRVAEAQVDDDGYWYPTSGEPADGLRQLRQRSRPNTVAVAAQVDGDSPIDLQPLGVDLDHVRVLRRGTPR